jgi:hypothetical protein
MKRSLLMMAVALAAVGARAAELKVAEVPAQAKWVAHLDAEKLRASQVGQKLLAEIQNDAKATAQLDAIRNAVGVDLRKDISDLTLGGGDEKKTNGVMIVRGPFNTDKLLAALRANPQHEEMAEGDASYHKWFDKGHDNFAGFLSGGRCVFSENREAAKTTADVIRTGQGGITAESTLGKLAKDAAGCLIFAAVDGGEGLPGDNKQPQAAILRKVTAAALRVTEKDGRVQGELAVTVATAEDAARIAEITRGLIALGQLAEDIPPPVARLAQTAQVKQDGQKIKVLVSCPPEDVLQFLKNKRGQPKEQTSSF